MRRSTTIPTLAVDNIQTWVLVTGVIRSGTTFAGKVLSFPREVDYIHEPFNGGYTWPGGERMQPRYLRPSVTPEALGSYYGMLERLFSYDFTLQTARNPHDSWPRKALKEIVGSRGPLYLRLARINPFHQFAIIKDPSSKLMADYLYHHFGVIPVILVRHPVSLAASLRRADWWPEVRDFADEPELVADYFADEPDFLQRTWPSRMLEAMAHWRAAYKVLLAQAKTYPDWHVVTHEAMSQQPVATFERLYHALALPWSDGIARRIANLTQGNGSAEARKGRIMDFHRNSADIFRMRRDSLMKAERRAIYDIVEDVALQLYSRESFAID
jgi:hypothetical protein